MSESLKAIDLFGGIGGFRLGLQQSDLDVEFVDYYDIDKYAVKSYNAIFGEDYEPTDISKISDIEGQIPNHDLLCAGFPCQSFSIAGRRQGFEDTRGTLFFEIARIARCKKPETLLLENVKGLLSHDNGETFQRILETLGDLGYYVEWQVLNSRRHGVPQNRERVFSAGHLGGEPGRKVFPLEGSAGKDSRKDAGTGLESLKKVVEAEQQRVVSNDGWRGVTTKRDGGVRSRNHATAVDANYWKGIDNHGARTAVVNHQMRPESRPSIQDEGQSGGSGVLFNYRYSYALSNSPHFVTDDRGKVRVHRDDDKKSEIQGYSAFLKSSDYVDVIDNHDKNIIERGEVNRIAERYEGKQDGGVYHPKGIAPTYSTGTGVGNRYYIPDGVNIRKLTPKECWRLQGFPDWAYEKAEQVNSDTQLYKQAGNAVTVNVVRDIATKVATVIDHE